MVVQGGEAIAFSLAQTGCAEGEAVGRAGRRRRSLKLLRFGFVSGRRREPGGRAQIVVIAVPATIHLGLSFAGVRFHLFIETSFQSFVPTMEIFESLECGAYQLISSNKKQQQKQINH